jgi:hypothetical protein
MSRQPVEIQGMLQPDGTLVLEAKPNLPAGPVRVTLQSLPESVPQTSDTIEQRFRQLAAAWHKAVAHHSSYSVRTKHPAYREIIALGPEVVPLLLQDIEENHTHWFCALREITGANPIPESAAGNIPKMVEAWLIWAQENGYR